MVAAKIIFLHFVSLMCILHPLNANITYILGFILYLPPLQLAVFGLFTLHFTGKLFFTVNSWFSFKRLRPFYGHFQVASVGITFYKSLSSYIKSGTKDIALPAFTQLTSRSSYRSLFGRPLAKRFALCYQTVVCPVCLLRWCIVAKRLNGSR